MLIFKEVADRASALIDRELGLFERLQLRLHLAMSKGCDAFIRQMPTTREFTQAATNTAPPEDEARRV